MQMIVLGTHRSGTSLVTRLINMMGAFFDSGHASIGFTDENPKGFWERSDVISCNDRLLSLHGSAWDRLSSWKLAPSKVRKASPALEEVEKDLHTILKTLDANRPWVVKDPRLCLTFPHWRQKLEKPVIICVHRDPMEVALSLKTRHGFSIAHGLALWEYYTVNLLHSIRGLPVIFVGHRQLLSDPVSTVKTLYASLLEAGVEGLHLPPQEEINAFIEPTLYRSKMEAKENDEALTAFQRQLSRWSSGEQPLPEHALEPSLAARDAMEVYEKSSKLHQQLNDVNERCATAEQKANELGDMRQKFLTEMQQVLLNHRKELEKKDLTIQRLRGSKSWKIGNLLVRFLTLQWWQRRNATNAMDAS